MEKLLTVREVAERCGLGYQQVRYLIITGRLKGTKVGWMWVIREEDIPKELQKNAG